MINKSAFYNSSVTYVKEQPISHSIKKSITNYEGKVRCVTVPSGVLISSLKKHEKAFIAMSKTPDSCENGIEFGLLLSKIKTECGVEKEVEKKSNDINTVPTAMIEIQQDKFFDHHHKCRSSKRVLYQKNPRIQKHSMRCPQPKHFQ